jgi:DNA-binding GntR family transcriptional regulator
VTDHPHPAAAIRPLPRRSVLADDVYEAVKALVMDHAIAPGARVSIDGLARDLQVSPTPVREALARLESDGLVTKEPLRGYRTTALLTREEFEDLYQLRLLLEPWAAAQAARRAAPADVERLRAEVDSLHFDASAESYEDYRALAAHDARFHVLVAELSGSRQVRQAFERTHCHLHLFRLHFTRGVGSRALDEHRAVTDAIAAGDAAAAEEAMRAHLGTSIAERAETIYGGDGSQPTSRPSV